jgi:hypothetical protein
MARRLSAHDDGGQDTSDVARPQLEPVVMVAVAMDG